MRYDGRMSRPATGIVSVRRTGGLAGAVVEGTADLASDPDAREIIALLDDIDLDAVPSSPPQPDRYVYRLGVSGRTVTVAEQNLTPELQRVVDLVLGG